VHRQLRSRIGFYDKDRLFAPDIEAAKKMVFDGTLGASCKQLFNGLYLD
jgi:histidine ammonia-lyase